MIEKLLKEKWSMKKIDLFYSVTAMVCFWKLKWKKSYRLKMNPMSEKKIIMYELFMRCQTSSISKNL